MYVYIYIYIYIHVWCYYMVGSMMFFGASAPPDKLGSRTKLPKS